MSDTLLCAKTAPADTSSDALGWSENDDFCTEGNDDTRIYQFEALAAVALIQNGRYRFAELHTFLYTVVCTDVATHQHGCKGHLVDSILRIG